MSFVDKPLFIELQDIGMLTKKIEQPCGTLKIMGERKNNQNIKKMENNIINATAIAPTSPFPPSPQLQT